MYGFLSRIPPCIRLGCSSFTLAIVASVPLKALVSASCAPRYRLNHLPMEHRCWRPCLRWCLRSSTVQRVISVRRGCIIPLWIVAFGRQSSGPLQHSRSSIHDTFDPDWAYGLSHCLFSTAVPPSSSIPTYILHLSMHQRCPIMISMRERSVPDVFIMDNGLQGRPRPSQVGATLIGCG